VFNAHLDDPIPGTTNQHDIMPYFLDKVTHALWEFNGNEGKQEDYLYWAHLTLNSVNYDPNFTQEDLDVLKNSFESQVLGPNGEHNFGCN